MQVGLSDVGVTCSSRDPRFAGSNSAEVVGCFFFQDVKILSTSSPGETLWVVGPEYEISGLLKNLKPEKYASEQNLIGVFTS